MATIEFTSRTQWRWPHTQTANNSINSKSAETKNQWKETQMDGWCIIFFLVYKMDMFSFTFTICVDWIFLFISKMMAQTFHTRPRWRKVFFSLTAYPFRKHMQVLSWIFSFSFSIDRFCVNMLYECCVVVIKWLNDSQWKNNFPGKNNSYFPFTTFGTLFNRIVYVYIYIKFTDLLVTVNFITVIKHLPNDAKLRLLGIYIYVQAWHPFSLSCQNLQR